METKNQSGEHWNCPIQQEKTDIPEEIITKRILCVKIFLKGFSDCLMIDFLHKSKKVTENSYSKLLITLREKIVSCSNFCCNYNENGIKTQEDLKMHHFITP